MIGAVLDRNGLRPSRYYVTKDDLRHHGVARSASSTSRPRTSCSRSGCSRADVPGRHRRSGRIVADEEIKQRARRGAAVRRVAGRAPDRHRAICRTRRTCRRPITRPCCARQQAFGYTQEDLQLLLAPMAHERRGGDRLDGHRHAARGAVGPAAAALRLLQAAVRAGHQPAARRDPRGAHHVDGLDHRARGQPARADARVVPPDQARVRRSSTTTSWRSCATSTASRGFTRDHAADAVRPSTRAAPGSSAALDELCRRRQPGGRRRRRHPDPVRPRRRRDARADPEPAGDGGRAPPPGPRGHAHARAGWSSRSGDAREVHHCALLLGYGAGAVNPYLAFETLDDMIRQRLLAGRRPTRRRSSNYIKALNKGILKVMSKMGISTLQSYCGAQIFEAVGLDAGLRRPVLHLDARRASAASAST